MKYELINPTGRLTIKEQIFYNRGITDAKAFIDIDQNAENSYKELNNITEGIKILANAISLELATCLIVDCDADGFTSAAIFINYLYEIFPMYAKSIDYFLHEGKVHGLSDLYDKVKNYKLIICIDSSSNDYEYHKMLSDNGSKVLVLDHHLADKISENACIINNQLCDYPNKALSGAGIALKFCQALDSMLGTNCANKFYDLAALGIISDVMNTTDLENRYIIKYGLNNINNPYFSAMVEKQTFCLKDGLNPIGVAFYITPFINATVRSGTVEDNKLLFESMLTYKANELIPSTKRGEKGKEEKIVTQVVRNSANIKKHQDDAKKAFFDSIKNIIIEQHLNDNKIIVLKLEEYIDSNLVGLLANQIMGEYQKPVIVLNKHESGWGGSARNVARTSFTDFRDFVRDSGFASLAEGHQSAFGIRFDSDEDVDDFITYSNIRLKNIDFSTVYKVDFIFGADEVYESDILTMANLHEFYGQGFEEPLIAIEHIPLKDIILMSPDKNPTLKIILDNGISLIKFKSSQEEFERLKPDNLNRINFINIVGKCAQNFWNGNVSAQILIEEYEVNEERIYYF